MQFVFFVTILTIAACKSQMGDYELRDAGSEMDKGAVLTTQQKAAITKGQAANEKAPGYPDAPRRILSFADYVVRDSVFSVGLQFSALNVKLDTTISYKFGLDYTALLTLVRTGENDRIINTDGTLAIKDGVAFVSYCSYVASAKTGTLGNAQISLLGAGANTSSEIGEKISVDQSSTFKKIEKGASLKVLRDQCVIDFKNKVRATVLGDLAGATSQLSAVKANPIHNDLQKGVKAAMTGEEVKGIRVSGEQFSVHFKVESKREGPNMRIAGRVIKWKKAAGIIPAKGETCHYTYLYEEDSGKILESSNEGGGAVKDLTDAIANEAFMQSRQERPYK